jgi:phosphoenolpyruvate mutase
MKRKIVYLTLVGDYLNAGHLNILYSAKKLGDVYVGLFTDKAAIQYTALPHQKYEDRETLLKSIKYIKKVIIEEDLYSYKNLKDLKPDYVIHGDNWKKGFLSKVRKRIKKQIKNWSGKLIEIKYTKNVPNSFHVKNYYKNFTTNEIRKNKLVRLLKIKNFLRFMEVHNPIGGIIIEHLNIESNNKYLEFDGFWSSSLTDSAVRGMPDNQSVDYSTRINILHNIFSVTSKPLLFDADNGGQIEHLKYLIKNLEDAGVSAIVLEDKIGLKKNSLFINQDKVKQDTVLNFSKKIKEINKWKSSKNFLIIARIESLILGKGVNDALKRAIKYSKAGADLILVHNNTSNTKNLFKFSKLFKKSKFFKPLVAIPTSYSHVHEKELIKNNFKIVIYANHLFRASYSSMKETANQILKDGRAFNADKDILDIQKTIDLIK